MTAKDFSKAKNQLGNKPAKWEKVLKHNKPLNKGGYGKGANRCRFTNTTRGVVRKYGLNICRRTFRLNAQKLGFKKLD